MKKIIVGKTNILSTFGIEKETKKAYLFNKYIIKNFSLTINSKKK